LELSFPEDGTGEAKVMSDEFITEMALFPPRLQRWTYYHDSADPRQNSTLLITQEMVESMKEGSVIMAAEQGGNYLPNLVRSTPTR